MCTSNNELKFCTCTDENIHDTKNIYIWSLNRYLGTKKSRIRGKIIIPIRDFQNGISVQSVIKKMNTENIFDFEYTPEERDILYISYNAENHNDYKYFSLIFLNNNWQEGRNPVFVSRQKNLATGKIIINQKDYQ